MSNDEQISITVRTIKVILFVVFVIPSTISASYIIYVSLRNSSFRQRFQNQTLIILICIILLMNLIHMPVDIRWLKSQSQLFRLIRNVISAITPEVSFGHKHRPFVCIGKRWIIFFWLVQFGSSPFSLFNVTFWFLRPIFFVQNDENSSFIMYLWSVRLFIWSCSTSSLM